MPQADLMYSCDIEVDAPALLAEIESAIADHDSGAGLCKGRAFPVQEFQSSHVMLSVALLNKPHRDDVFMQALLVKLVKVVDEHITQTCSRSVQLNFLSPFYETGLILCEKG